MAKKEEEKTFEQAILELEKIVKNIKSGNASLDESIEKYTEGMKLAKVCGDKLNDATLKINKILKEDGKLEDFEIPEE